MTAPALGYSIVANLGGDRQMTVQCFAGEDEADETVNAKMDRAFRVVDRQKARYELVDLHDELLKVAGALSQFTEDKARIDHDIDVKLAMIDVQASVGNETLEGMKDQAYSQHLSSGRQGEFKPSGATKANIDRTKAGLAQLVDQKAAIEAERKQHHESVMISIHRHEEAVANLRERIASREALVG